MCGSLNAVFESESQDSKATVKLSGFTADETRLKFPEVTWPSRDSARAGSQVGSRLPLLSLLNGLHTLTVVQGPPVMASPLRMHNNC